jgi:hypothetical protein
MEKRDEENFAVDAIVATSEPQVPKPRTKKPEGKKKKKKKRTRKKSCSLARSGQDKCGAFWRHLPEKLANSHSLTSSES